MIKFFRNIRQKLLAENRFGRYLIYAIGEIILVVIGILIALQVNNWNDSQKEQKRVQQLIANLQKELKEDRSYLENVYQVERDLFLPSAERLFLVHSRTVLEIPSDSILGFSFRYATFAPIIKYSNNVFNELMASNLLDDRDYDSLKTKLFEYYAQIEFLKNYSEQNNGFQTQLMTKLSHYYTIIPADKSDAREISQFSGAAESSFTATCDLKGFQANKSLNALLYDMVDIHKDRMGGLENILQLSTDIQKELSGFLK